MSDVVPFPRREFRNAFEAATFANERFDEVVRRREKAALSCDRDQMQVVLDIYERDIIPYSARFVGHMAVDLLNFGQWLQDGLFIERSIEILRTAPLDLVATPEPIARARRGAALGMALLARGELGLSRPYFLEAIDAFNAALSYEGACSNHDNCHSAVGLALAHLALAENDLDESHLDAGIAALVLATPLQTHECLSLDLARQRSGEAKAQLLLARLRGRGDISVALSATEEAVFIYRAWEPPYVIPAVWIDRVAVLRRALADLA